LALGTRRKSDTRPRIPSLWKIASDLLPKAHNPMALTASIARCVAVTRTALQEERMSEDAA
jgi:hypothetical protein